jgi:hypothetical protein
MIQLRLRLSRIALDGKDEPKICRRHDRGWAIGGEAIDLSIASPIGQKNRASTR